MSSEIYWTLQARDDLRAIRAHIARDAPATASAYVRAVRNSVERLRRFPKSGQVVPEIGREEIREIFHGSYRLIYRVSHKRLEMLAVFHSAQVLRDMEL